MNLTVGHLYPDLMNIYSDMGNIICLKKRCLWREINIKIIPISLKEKLVWQKYDLVFGGGGQDRQQKIITEDLQTKKADLKKAVEAGVPMLTTCGTYQLFGHYFKTHEGTNIPGISIFDAYTVASHQRKIGNIVIRLNNETMKQFNNDTIVGFENHSGNTYINRSTTIPLGKVIKGFGNNGRDKTEGAIYKNCLGTYLHGPVLPKNPHLADWLIKTALERKYKKKVDLKSLDDSLEWQTHEQALKRS